jgi:enoyl-CoA hydratase/3-hydroxyacyl-CoA dehydrogenase
VDDPVAAGLALLEQHQSGQSELAPISPAPLELPDPWPEVDIGHRSRAIDAILVDVLRRGLVLPLEEGLALEADGFARCKQTIDMDIGLKNFFQNGARVPAVFLNE